MAKTKEPITTQSATRPPVVTIMGHVDHGKTSLLDAIRQTSVTAGESGGITQHIGAYQVEHNGQKITFIDTPGHAAFSKMRARGANITDIVILVVAANDGVMPQTKEAIAHTKAAGVPMIVAMNKIDVEGANPQKAKDGLAKEEVLVEGYGGDIPVVETSAIQKTGINELLDMVLLVADLQELKNEPDVPVEGAVIESNQDTRRGPLATVLIQKGTLKIGDNVQIGNTFGKVRSLTDDKGQSIKVAGPSTPVEIMGLKAVPTVGSLLTTQDNEKAAEAAATQIVKDEEKPPVEITDISQLFNMDSQKELKIVLKGDTQGSVEAIMQSINELETPEDGSAARFLLSGTGNVSESDALLAATANALIIAFRVKVDSAAQRVIQQDSLLVQSYDIIYQLLEDIQGVLAYGIPVKEVPVKGRAEVQQIFTLKSGDVIAGCKVTHGMIRKNWKVQVWRMDEEAGEEVAIVEQAAVHEVRHGADKVNEAKKNSECGIMIRPNFEFQVGDRIEAL